MQAREYGDGRIIGYIKKFWYLIFAAVIFIFIQAGFELLNADYQKRIIDSISMKSFDQFKPLLLIGFIVFFVTVLVRMVNEIFSESINASLTKNLNLNIMEHTHKIPLVKYEEYHPGYISSLFKNDIRDAGNIIVQALNTFTLNIVIFLAALIYLFILDYKIALVILACCVLIVINNVIFNRYIRKYSLLANQKKDEIQGFLENTLCNIAFIKSYNFESPMVKKFTNMRSELKFLEMKRSFISTLMSGVLDFANFAVIGGVGLYICYLSIKGVLSIGLIMAFNTLFSRMIGSVIDFSRNLGGMQVAFAAWDRLNQFLAVEEVTNKSETDTSSEFKPEDIDKIQYNNITFGYKKEKKVLSSAQITVEKGKLYGLVGKSGTGKSTLFKILLDLYFVEDVKIFLNDKYAISKDSSLLPYQVSFVSQVPMLRSGALRDNICFGRTDISDDKIMRHAEMMGMSNLITQLDNGLDTNISESGSNLSGGQRQKIAILRAVLSDALFIVFDEPFSNLDQSAERELINYLDKIKKDKMILFSSHRLEPLKCCDSIGVISDGRIQEYGSYHEFIEENPVYSV